MGAALNQMTGVVLQSGPIFGTELLNWNLLDDLHALDDGLTPWHLLNDLTACALAYGNNTAGSQRKVSVVSIGSGIGSRTYDARTGRVALDKSLGIQGEIGHFRRTFFWRGEAIDLVCACGGSNHLNSFSSGLALESLIPILLPTFGDISSLQAGVRSGDQSAMELLRAVTLPVAEIIGEVVAIDPEIDSVVLTGGVVELFGSDYLRVILDHLTEDAGGYLTQIDPGHYARQLSIGGLGSNAGLLGAGEFLNAQTPKASASKSNFSRAPGVQHTHALTGSKWRVTGIQHLQYEIALQAGVVTNADPSTIRALVQCSEEPPARCLLIMDQSVHKTFENWSDVLSTSGVSVATEVIPGGEDFKTFSSIDRLLTAADNLSLVRRRDPFIVIGGGAVMDTAGLAASLYRRGTPYIRIPTTLLGIIDAGVGIKTGINFGGHRNRAGAYFPPIRVLADPLVLHSLSRRQMACGLAEMLKVATIAEQQLFELMESNANSLLEPVFYSSILGQEALERSISLMARELAPNLFEDNLSRLMDFGHTFTAETETRMSSSFLHGEAVGLDIAISSLISLHRGILSRRDCNRVLALLKQFDLPTEDPLFDADVFAAGLADSIRHRGGIQRIALPVGIGCGIFVSDIEIHEVVRAHAALQMTNA
jgi:3-dehydroquinate synthase